jgi:phage terminase large subunit-like protein
MPANYSRCITSWDPALKSGSRSDYSACAVMDAWGYTFKTQTLWDKGKTGLGLVFRNQHEPLGNSRDASPLLC